MLLGTGNHYIFLSAGRPETCRGETGLPGPGEALGSFHSGPRKTLHVSSQRFGVEAPES